MTESIRVALFGNGFARSVALPCLRLVDGIRLVGMASPNLERARETAAAFGIETVAADHREILEKARPDLVLVATPPHRHAEMAIDALTAGCHVLCEKPTALNAAESERMLLSARSRPNQLALIDHELRSVPAREVLRGLVERGALGKIRRAEYRLYSFSRRDPSRSWNWWSDLHQGGGALGAIGSHAVDSLRVYLGEVAEVAGTLSTWVAERPDPVTAALRPVTADDAVLAWLRFESGALGEISISSAEGERLHRLGLTGDKGAATVDERGPLRAAFDPVDAGEPMPVHPVADDLPPSEELGIPDTDWARGFLRQMRKIAQAVRTGQTAIPGAATFEDGHRNQLVLDAVRRAHASGGWEKVATS